MKKGTKVILFVALLLGVSAAIYFGDKKSKTGNSPSNPDINPSGEPSGNSNTKNPSSAPNSNSSTSTNTSGAPVIKNPATDQYNIMNKIVYSTANGISLYEGVGFLGLNSDSIGDPLKTLSKSQLIGTVIGYDSTGAFAKLNGIIGYPATKVGYVDKRYVSTTK